MAGYVDTPRRHYCDPGWTSYVIADSEDPELNGQIGLSPPSTGTRAGSVWQCECGKTWVAYYPLYDNLVSFVPQFKPEGRVHRWLREHRKTN